MALLSCQEPVEREWRSLTSKNLLESYHGAQQALDQALNLFSLWS
jgi:hypothetical protein